MLQKASSCSPNPPQAHGEGSRSLSQPLAHGEHSSACSPLMNCPNLTTFVSPLLLLAVDLFQLCSHGSQSLRGSCSPHLLELPMRSPVPIPSLFHLAVHRQTAQGEGSAPWSSGLGIVPATGHGHHLQRCCTRDTHSHLSCSPVQFNYQLGSSPAKHKKSTHCSCFCVLLPC